MVHGVAEQSGGQLVLESTKGAGTTVTLWLPAADADHAPVPSPQILVSTHRPDCRALKALVVDDDSLVLRNTALMLEDLGHEVIEAGSGAEALRRLEDAQGVELVVTDQNMPGMTGLQLAEQITKKWPDVKIVLATGYADLPEGKGVSLPRLPKPFTQATLADLLSSVLPGRA
jgi:CheY-like chemotaxis protein